MADDHGSMAHEMAHEHGTMNTSQQEKTFHGFIRLAITVGATAIAILIFMALVNA